MDRNLEKLMVVERTCSSLTIIKNVVIIIFALFIFFCIKDRTYAATAQDSNGISWYYTVGTDEEGNSYAYNVYWYSGTIGSTLEIPSELAGYPVVGIRGYSTSELSSSSYRSNILRSTSSNTTITKVIIPNTVRSIGNNTFANFRGLTEVEIPNSVTSIGAYAFYYGMAMTGKLKIPDSVTSIGSYAFYSCRNLDGKLIIGNGVTTIGNYAFHNDEQFTKVEIGTSITTIGNYAFDVSDIWINTTEENVTLNNYEGYVHWKDHTHNVYISLLPGVKLINIDNNQEVVSGDYECETTFRYRIEIANGYNYSNLKLIEINDNDISNYESYDIQDGDEYEFTRLVRDRKIYVENINEGLDLSLRTFIYSVNRATLINSREPVVSVIDGNLQYLHTKYPYAVKQGDLVTYKIRIYNEGVEAGEATKVSVYIPEGLEFDETSRANIGYKWTMGENGKLYTDYLLQTGINGYTGNGILDYVDIPLDLKVTQESNLEKNVRLNVIAEIEEQSSADADSVSGSIQSVVGSDYKEAESYASTESSYVKGQEEDDDFESVIILEDVAVSYNIKINKIK